MTINEQVSYNDFSTLIHMFIKWIIYQIYSYIYNFFYCHIVSLLNNKKIFAGFVEINLYYFIKIEK